MPVHPHSGLLHTRQHQHQGHFNFHQDALQAWLRGKTRPELGIHPPADVRIFRRIGQGFDDGDIGKIPRRFAFPRHFFVGNVLVLQMPLRQGVQIMIVLAAIQHIAFQQRVPA